MKINCQGVYPLIKLKVRRLSIYEKRIPDPQTFFKERVKNLIHTLFNVFYEKKDFVFFLIVRIFSKKAPLEKFILKNLLAEPSLSV